MSAGRLGSPRAHLVSSQCFASDRPDFPSEILKLLNVRSVLVVSQDSFYKSLTPEQSKAVSRVESRQVPC